MQIMTKEDIPNWIIKNRADEIFPLKTRCIPKLIVYDLSQGISPFCGPIQINYSSITKEIIENSLD